MGVLQFFGALTKNGVTASSIKQSFTGRLEIDHLLFDFNSIVHVSSQKIIAEVNIFLEIILKNIYHNRYPLAPEELFQKYKLEPFQKNIKEKEAIEKFHEHFDSDMMDKLIITLVINTVLQILKTYTYRNVLKTVLIAIDGVPSKGKMIEQKQRRYFGAVSEDYKKHILRQYKEYLQELPDNAYLMASYPIKWSRNKITPGTAFMHKLVQYLKSEKIQESIKKNRPHLKIIISDMYEVGEAEKKIVNYIKKYLSDTEDTVMFYSPDTDVVLLCMLLPVEKLYMLRHNQQTTADMGKNIYDLITIKDLKSNIAYYINQESKLTFSTDRINDDIVCLSTLFGNDFVPKIETIDVKIGFQYIMDAYVKSLVELQEKGYYLVAHKNGSKRINFTFLKSVLHHLVPREKDFIKNNILYRQYITIGQIKYAFDYMEINSDNLVSVYTEFRRDYDDLKNILRNNRNPIQYVTNERFMLSLKRTLIIQEDGEQVNISEFTNRDIINTLKKYYYKTRDFPRLNINLNTWSHSTTDMKHKKVIKEKKYNKYQTELYKFDKMLDEYYTKFNAQPLDLSKDEIPSYYQTYFDVKNLYKKGKLTTEANTVMRDYIEGLLWVFEYYFNDGSYVNLWYYVHERAPLLQHLEEYLESINLEEFREIYEGLTKYQIKNLKNFFNPLEQLIYVSPLTEDIIKLLPSNYRKYLTSKNLDPFLRNYFVNVSMMTKKLWNEKISPEVDCRSVPYLNKCHTTFITKTTSSEDKEFLKAIRKVEPTEISERRSKCVLPKY